MGRDALIEALINERAARAMEFDDAYPDVGPGLSWGVARYDAIESLKKEGLIPNDYVDSRKNQVSSSLSRL